jgi:hypothetical protein
MLRSKQLRLSERLRIVLGRVPKTPFRRCLQLIESMSLEFGVFGVQQSSVFGSDRARPKWLNYFFQYLFNSISRIGGSDDLPVKGVKHR